MQLTYVGRRGLPTVVRDKARHRHSTSISLSSSHSRLGTRRSSVMACRIRLSVHTRSGHRKATSYRRKHDRHLLWGSPRPMSGRCPSTSNILPSTIFIGCHSSYCDSTFKRAQPTLSCFASALQGRDCMLLRIRISHSLRVEGLA